MSKHLVFAICAHSKRLGLPTDICQRMCGYICIIRSMRTNAFALTIFHRLLIVISVNISWPTHLSKYVIILTKSLKCNLTLQCSLLRACVKLHRSIHSIVGTDLV